jgi:RNA polymerase sigma factor (sigma-70 family)
VVGSRPPDEAGLIARSRRGDADAYARLVAAHGEVAFRTAYAIGGNAADAEDAAQEGFVKAYRALGRFREGSSFRPWLLAIVANEARNRRRGAARREALVLRAGRDRTEGDAAPSPETAVLAAERREMLVAALGRLADRDREIIVLRHLLELSEEETAAALGCRVGTAKSRLSRAMERLRSEMGGDA